MLSSFSKFICTEIKIETRNVTNPKSKPSNKSLPHLFLNARPYPFKPFHPCKYPKTMAAIKNPILKTA